MRSKGSLANGWIKLVDYQRIIEKYLPYVFTKCSRYTRSEQVAGNIAVYVFVCVYYMAEKLDDPALIPVAIETMIEVVGSDLSDGTVCEDCESSLILDPEQSEGIIRTVMKYLIKQN